MTNINNNSTRLKSTDINTVNDLSSQTTNKTTPYSLFSHATDIHNNTGSISGNTKKLLSTLLNNITISFAENVKVIKNSIPNFMQSFFRASPAPSQEKVQEIHDTFVDHLIDVAAKKQTASAHDAPEQKSMAKEAAAKTIQRAFRTHREKITDAKVNSQGYTRLTYSGNRPDEKGKEYYLRMDPAGAGLTKDRVVYRPVNKPAHAARGAFKQLEHVDDKKFKRDKHGGIVYDANGKAQVIRPSRFVSLTPVEKESNFSREGKVNNNDLRGTSTIIYNRVVDDRLMIAPDAGKEVMQISPDGYITELKTLKFSAFQQALKDLEKLHNRKTFLIDITPRNMAYKEEQNQVNLIDIDGRMSQSSGYDKINFGSGTSTKELLEHYDSLSEKPGKAALEKLHELLTIWDNYAFLASSIMITTENPALQDAIIAPEEVDEDSGLVKGGLLNERNSDLFKTWINGHVKEEYRKDIDTLLRNPGNFFLNPPDSWPLPLSEMLLFT